MVLTLSACSAMQTKPTTPVREPDVVVSHKLVAKKIPGELLEIPEYPDNPSADATQKDISIWLLENEKRTRTLEGQLKAIKELNDKE